MINKKESRHNDARVCRRKGTTLKPPPPGSSLSLDGGARAVEGGLSLFLYSSPLLPVFFRSSSFQTTSAAISPRRYVEFRFFRRGDKRVGVVGGFLVKADDLREGRVYRPRVVSGVLTTNALAQVVGVFRIV